MENSIKFPQETKHRTIIWPSNSTPGHISGKDESSSSKRYKHPNVHSTAVLSGQNMEATQELFNRWMDKEDAIYATEYIYATECCFCCSVTKSYLILCNPMICSRPGSSIHGISQARILQGVAISSSRGSSQPMDQTCWLARLAGRFFNTEPPS